MNAIETRNQHLQQTWNAANKTLRSGTEFLGNVIATVQSVLEAVELGYNNCKTACSKISNNLHGVSIGVCAVSLLCPPLAYSVLTNVAAHPISYLTYSFILPTTYNFFKHTNGAQNIQDTLSSAGGVLSNGVQAVKELGNTAGGAINTVKNYLLNQDLDHDSQEINGDAVDDHNNAYESIGDEVSLSGADAA